MIVSATFNLFVLRVKPAVLLQDHQEEDRSHPSVREIKLKSRSEPFEWII